MYCIAHPLHNNKCFGLGLVNHFANVKLSLTPPKRRQKKKDKKKTWHRCLSSPISTSQNPKFIWNMNPNSLCKSSGWCWSLCHSIAGSFFSSSYLLLCIIILLVRMSVKSSWVWSPHEAYVSGPFTNKINENKQVNRVAAMKNRFVIRYVICQPTRLTYCAEKRDLLISLRTNELPYRYIQQELVFRGDVYCFVSNFLQHAVCLCAAIEVKIYYFLCIIYRHFQNMWSSFEWKIIDIREGVCVCVCDLTGSGLCSFILYVFRTSL